MCGICGYVHLDTTRRASEDIVKAMTATLAHRGPDDSGLYVKDSVGLGHRRLSIIDLTTGHQPMKNEDGSLIIVYNGEIYNYRGLKEELESRGHAFASRSDTETILHAYEEYGERCVEKLDGMFSFALWDHRTRTLFLARDRFGKKPLYYCLFKNQFIFGSELKALLEHPDVPRVIDMESVSKYLAYDYVPSPRTIFKDIRRVEAGHTLTVSPSGLRTRKYWDVSFDIKDEWKDAVPECSEELRLILRESTRKRLISDVPLGVFLSGGIDSSAVVAMMAEFLEPKEIRTFSIGFEEAPFDESHSARLVADFFSTDHHQEVLNARRMLDVLPEVVGFLDEPFADSSIIPTYLISRYTRGFVKVALGGDGGDELFMGYPSFAAHVMMLSFDNVLPQLWSSLSTMPFVMSGSSDQRSSRFRFQRFLKGLRYQDAVRHQVWIGTFSPAEQEKLLSSERGTVSFDPRVIYSDSLRFMQEVRHLHPLDRIAYLYMKTYMTDDILTKVDRASMANGLEVRAPFLDAEFSRFVNTIPHSLKIKGFSGKFILKQALAGILPDEVLRKKKHGFAVPISHWLRGGLKELLLETFQKGKIERQGIFSFDRVDQLIKEHLSGKKDNGREIWSLFIFELWYNKLVSSGGKL